MTDAAQPEAVQSEADGCPFGDPFCNGPGASNLWATSNDTPPSLRDGDGTTSLDLGCLSVLHDEPPPKPVKPEQEDNLGELPDPPDPHLEEEWNAYWARFVAAARADTRAESAYREKLAEFKLAWKKFKEWDNACELAVKLKKLYRCPSCAACMLCLTAPLRYFTYYTWDQGGQRIERQIGYHPFGQLVNKRPEPHFFAADLKYPLVLMGRETNWRPSRWAPKASYLPWMLGETVPQQEEHKPLAPTRAAMKRPARTKDAPESPASAPVSPAPVNRGWETCTISVEECWNWVDYMESGGGAGPFLKDYPRAWITDNATHGEVSDRVVCIYCSEAIRSHPKPHLPTATLALVENPTSDVAPGPGWPGSDRILRAVLGGPVTRRHEWEAIGRYRGPAAKLLCAALNYEAELLFHFDPEHPAATPPKIHITVPCDWVGEQTFTLEPIVGCEAVGQTATAKIVDWPIIGFADNWYDRGTAGSGSGEPTFRDSAR